MIAVIFEVFVNEEYKQEYLEIAAKIRPKLAQIKGFISIERFQSLSNPGKMLSISFWENEEALAQWRNFADHREAQKRSREALFGDYRLRVAAVVRDYSRDDREQAPEDSRVLTDI
ncbi:MAG: antibiotic biosynthesis monooxygenase [Thermoanaerobacterales bacterium]|jgi:heme-degrading monooxygenase HmoA|nr:antibiotic biosynthesis monooxygenase [Thermoanaerobacterales bacterium]